MFILVFIIALWITGIIIAEKMGLARLLENSLKAPLFFIVTWREFLHSLLILAYLFLLNLGKSHKVLGFKVSYLQYFRVFLTLVGFTGVGILWFK
ncbi:membrane protein [Beggiatoa sp. PS]|nr:membrane protein [Beggiatoa sp. PS]